MGAGAGAFGPYEHGSGFRVVVRRTAGGSTVSETFATRGEAEEALAAARAELLVAHEPLGDLIDRYEDDQKKRGLRSSTYKQTRTRLRAFFASALEVNLPDLTRHLAEKLFEALRDTPTTSTKKPPSVDTLRNTLAETRAFVRWCRSQGWMRGPDPLIKLKVFGKRRRGKPQLRIDEARVWYSKAIELADAGDDGAVAGLSTLLLAPRASELVSRLARDLDDNGRILWIDDEDDFKTKTDSSRRKVEIPEILQPYLRRLADGKDGSAPLFPSVSRYWPRDNIRRICGLAGVRKVSAHGMRGLHSTLAVAAGATAHLVAASLGHSSSSVTERHYIAPGTTRNARAEAALRVLSGGRSPRAGVSTGVSKGPR